MKYAHVFALFLFSMGCGAGFAKTVARHSVEVALAACIAEHEWMEEQELKEVCVIAEDMMPIVRDLLSAHKRGSAKRAAMVCGDAGSK